MTKHYAIASFRNSGSIKSWGTLRAAQVHNSRERPIPHAEEDVDPVHIVGSGDLVADAKLALRRHGIDPAGLRKNGVIAYELVLSATREFFCRDDCSLETETEMSCRWMLAQRDFLLQKYGADRLVSLVAHFDERTPHVHAVILPLEHKTDARRCGTAPRWSLVGRSVAGPGEYQRLQDEYGAAMAQFGLCRGEAGAGRKHKPVRDYLAEIEDARREAEEAKQKAALAEEQAIQQSQTLAELIAVFGGALESVREFLDDVRDLPAHTLPPQVRRMRDDAGKALENVKRTPFPDIAGPVVQRHWQAVQQGIAR